MVMLLKPLAALCALVSSLGLPLASVASDFDLQSMQEISQRLKTQPLTQDDQTLVDGARKQAEVIAGRDTSWLNEIQEKRKEQVSELIRSGSLPIGKHGAEAPGVDGKAFPNRAIEEGPMTFVLVSWSMPRSELLDILVRLEGKKAAIVFRGIPADTTMVDALQKMHSLTSETKSEVPVLLDPYLFQRSDTTVVPVIVKEDDQKLLAKVTGLSDPDFLERAIADGKSGDLGVQGPTLDILEPDFMTVIQEKIEKLDYEEMKKRALKRYWENMKFVQLPEATEHQIRNVDAHIILPKDITTPDGTVVARAGAINPLKLRNFTQRVVVIDATSDWQVDFAKQQVEQFRNQQRVTVITTMVDPVDGWSTFGKTSDHIGARIGLLDENFKSRFGIERIPSVLTADDSNFIVEEFIQPTIDGL